MKAEEDEKRSEHLHGVLRDEAEPLQENEQFVEEEQETTKGIASPRE